MFSAPVALGLLLSTAAVAQQYVISTVAGGAPPTTPIAAVNASIGQVRAVAGDSAGNTYFTSFNNCVFKLDPNGVLTRIAGNARAGYSGDGGPATNAQLFWPAGVAVDAAGNVYVADYGNFRVRMISPSGIISTVAGSGPGSSVGDGGPAISANLGLTSGLAIDAVGNLYIADLGNDRVRKVSANGIITTVAGTGVNGYSGDGGPGIGAQLSGPASITVDSAGNLFIAESGNRRVRKVSANGIITTFAGTGAVGSSGDGGQATSAQLNFPEGVAADAGGNVYIADYGSLTIRKVDLSGNISTVVTGLGGPSAVSVDRAGNLYIADEQVVRKLQLNGVLSIVAGNGTMSYSGDGSLATGAQLASPAGIVVDAAGNIYIADYGNNRVRKIAGNGIITTLAGTGVAGFAGDGGPATNGALNNPSGVAVDAAGNVYIADYGNNRIRKVSANGILTTVAGTGVAGFAGDGGPATNAQLNTPYSVTVDVAGNLYIADTGNNRIRKVLVGGTVTTIAGTGTAGDLGSGGPATKAQLNAPRGLALDPAGNLYVADSTWPRKVSPNGIITTIFVGGGSLGVALDSIGNLYIAQIDNAIRKVSPAGTVDTIAGIPGQQFGQSVGYFGDGGPGNAALLYGPSGVAVDLSGSVYISDTGNGAIRRLQPTSAALHIGSITNAASNSPGPIAPGEIVTITGSGLGPAQLVGYHIGSSGLVDCQLAGTIVQVNGTCAPIIYTWTTQIAAIVPYSVSTGTAQVTVTYQGQTTAAVSIPVASSAPGLFTLDSTGKGPAAAVNQDGSINTAGTPAKIGDVILLYETGEGQTTPSGVDGKPAAVPLPQPNLPITVTIGGQTVKPQYAGGAPGEVEGVMQINVQIPSGIQTGNAVPIVVQVGSVSSLPGVTIAVR